LDGRTDRLAQYSRRVIVGAGLMVLVGVGLFVGGVLTGENTLYWACVVACIVAGGLLIAARRQMDAAADRAPGRAAASARGGSTAASAVGEDSGSGTRRATVAEAPRAHRGAPAEQAPAEQLGDPPAEEVEVTDLLLIVDLKDEVYVIDEHPRYHVQGCPHLRGRAPIPLPMDEARTDGFTPCGVCSPDRTIAERERARRAGRTS
jgi:hypothetical protein